MDYQKLTIISAHLKCHHFLKRELCKNRWSGTGSSYYELGFVKMQTWLVFIHTVTFYQCLLTSYSICYMYRVPLV